MNDFQAGSITELSENLRVLASKCRLPVFRGAEAAVFMNKFFKFWLWCSSYRSSILKKKMNNIININKNNNEDNF